MAAYTRNNLLGGSGAGDNESDDESIDFVPVSLSLSAAAAVKKPKKSKSKEKEKKELKAKEKKQAKRIARLKVDRSEKERNALEGSVSDRLSELHGSQTNGMQMSGSERLDIAGELLNESQALFEEVEKIVAPKAVLEEAAKDDEGFSNTMSAIKKKKELEQQKEKGRQCRWVV